MSSFISIDPPSLENYRRQANEALPSCLPFCCSPHILAIAYQLILVAVETKRHGHAGLDGEYNVVVNPGGDYRIGKGDRGFVLAESQVRTCVGVGAEDT